MTPPNASQVLLILLFILVTAIVGCGVLLHRHKSHPRHYGHYVDGVEPFPASPGVYRVRWKSGAVTLHRAYHSESPLLKFAARSLPPVSR